jgi:hypothetical protein
MIVLIVVVVIIVVFLESMLSQHNKSSKNGGYHQSRPNKQQAINNARKEYADLLENTDIDDILKDAKLCIDYDDISHQKKYVKSKDIIKPTLHNGQLKLFLSEVQFLTDIPGQNTSKIYVIYAGSAPSNKLPYLSTLFPHITWILVDPNIHYLNYHHLSKDQYDDVLRTNMLYFKISKYYKSHASDIGDNSKVRDKRLNLYVESNEITDEMSNDKSNEMSNDKSNEISNDKSNEISNEITTKLVNRTDKLQGAIPANMIDIIEMTSYKYYVIEDYYSDELSILFNKLTIDHPVYFISDIRSNTDENIPPKDLDILWNSAMMYNWLTILKPTLFMLKFRVPYTITDASIKELIRDYEASPFTHDAFNQCSQISFIDDFKNKQFRFIKGDTCRIQAFAGPSSTEARLIGHDLEPCINYDPIEYENKFFYYNRIHRSYGWHTSHEEYIDYSVISKDDTSISKDATTISKDDNSNSSQKLGVDRCGDCALMCHILVEYCKKYNKLYDRLSIRNMVREILISIQRSILKDHHGSYLTQYIDRDDLIAKQLLLIK